MKESGEKVVLRVTGKASASSDRSSSTRGTFLGPPAWVLNSHRCCPSYLFIHHPNSGRAAGRRRDTHASDSRIQNSRVEFSWQLCPEPVAHPPLCARLRLQASVGSLNLFTRWRESYRFFYPWIDPGPFPPGTSDGASLLGSAFWSGMLR